MIALINKHDAHSRFGKRYLLARCGKCRSLYLRPMPDRKIIGEACSCGGTLGLTTWGKSLAKISVSQEPA